MKKQTNKDWQLYQILDDYHMSISKQEKLDRAVKVKNGFFISNKIADISYNTIQKIKKHFK